MSLVPPPWASTAPRRWLTPPAKTNTTGIQPWAVSHGLYYVISMLETTPFPRSLLPSAWPRCTFTINARLYQRPHVWALPAAPGRTTAFDTIPSVEYTLNFHLWNRSSHALPSNSLIHHHRGLCKSSLGRVMDGGSLQRRGKQLTVIIPLHRGTP